jgi:hypothetical protein
LYRNFVLVDHILGLGLIAYTQDDQTDLNRNDNRKQDGISGGESTVRSDFLFRILRS